MKKLILLPLLILLLGSAASAQTLKIAHKSHSGKAATFSPNDFDLFGLSPEAAQKMKEEAAKKKAEEEKKQKGKDKKKKKEKEKKVPAVIPAVPNPAVVPTGTDPSEVIKTPQPPAPAGTEPEQVEKTKQDAPRKTKRVKQKKAVGMAEPAGMEEMTVTEETITPSPQLAEQRSNRMTWLYSLMGLVILPGIVLASGAFRKSADPNA